MTLEERIIKAITKSIEGKHVVKLESRLLEDLDVDSFDKLMIIGCLEDEFNIRVDEEEFTDVRVVSDIVEKIRTAAIS